ncbi:MAG: hypothetical protein KGJ90_04690 [Patescibacteria group bacterium]|nr:hypothetical protein [Patescibacteria group bacterium]
MRKRLIRFKVGDIDGHGKRVVAISDEGWYRDEDGILRDENGYEWYGQSFDGSARMDDDAISGQRVLVRDFKIAMKPMSLADPKEFYNHYRKIIEETMVETGYDYLDDNAVSFGETDDGFVHIYVKMKKKAWKNRENAYAGMKLGSISFKSNALVKAGAANPFIKGSMTPDGISVQEILKRSGK